MSRLNLYFSIYVPVYVYLILIIYIVALISNGLSRDSSRTLGLFHALNRSDFHSTLLTLTLLCLLGTPPTIGFFSKVLTFSVFVDKGGLFLSLAVITTLIMLIFYLQATRYRALSKKRSVIGSAGTNENLIWFLVIGQLCFLAFFFILPVAFDILFCYLFL